MASAAACWLAGWQKVQSTERQRAVFCAKPRRLESWNRPRALLPRQPESRPFLLTSRSACHPFLVTSSAVVYFMATEPPPQTTSPSPSSSSSSPHRTTVLYHRTTPPADTATPAACGGRWCLTAPAANAATRSASLPTTSAKWSHHTTMPPWHHTNSRTGHGLSTMKVVGLPFAWLQRVTR